VQAEAADRRSGAGNSPAQTRVSVQRLLEGDPQSNPWIEAHDEVRVGKAGLVYVLGAVVRPGGYPLERETVTVLRAISLAQGLDRRAAPQKARIIRREQDHTQEIALRIGDILRGKGDDAALRDNDILFVPDSRAKGALSRGAEAAIQMATGVIIWRR
jgi:polysaccharide export outer membrane protein